MVLLFAGLPLAEASGLVRMVARYCLRNVGATFTCYVFGRGGELVVDGSLTAAWNRAMAAEKSEPEQGNDKDKDKGAAGTGVTRQDPAGAPPGTTGSQMLRPGTLWPGTSISERLGRQELGSLAEKLVKQGQLKGPGSSTPADGFLVYVPTQPQPDGGAPKQGTGTGPPLTQSSPFDLPSSKGSPSGTTQPFTTKLGRQPSASEEACRRERERATGLRLTELVMADKATAEKLKQRRLNEVIIPCLGK